MKKTVQNQKSKTSQPLTKIKRRINSGFYGILTGILFILIGILWNKVVEILIEIQGFGLGEIVNQLPKVGIAVIVFGIVWIVINLVKLFLGQLVYQEKVPKKKDTAVDLQQISQEVSQFEKKHIKGIVFDLDGTLLDTIEDLADAGNQALVNYQLPTQTVEVFRQSVGNGVFNLMRKVAPSDLSDEEITLLYQEMNKQYGLVYANKTKAYEGVYEMISDLNRRGYLLAVVSNKKDEFTKALVKMHFPDIPFVDVVGETTDMPRKPNPQVMEYIAGLMMLDKSELVMVGDSEVDVETAVNSGCLSISVDWGFRPVSVLKETWTDYIVSMPSELVLIMDEVNRRDEFDIYSKNQKEKENQ